MAASDILSFLSLFIAWLPIAVLLVNYKHASPAFRPLGLLLFVNLAFFVATYYFATRRMNNLFLLNILTLNEFVFYSLFFLKLDKRNRFGEGLVRFGLIIVPVSLVNIIFVQGLFRYNSYTIPLQGIFIILYCIAYLVYFASLGETARTPTIVLALVSILLYFSGTFFLFLFDQLVFIKSILSKQLILVNYVFSILSNLILAVAFWRIPLQSKPTY